MLNKNFATRFHKSSGKIVGIAINMKKKEGKRQLPKYVNSKLTEGCTTDYPE